MKTKNKFKNLGKIVILLSIFSISGCNKSNDTPKKENDTEVITDVKLIFTNTTNSNDIVTAKAQDRDGVGVKPLAILDQINLSTSKTYELTYEILNKTVTPNSNITEEIKKEDVDHQFFYSFTDNIFDTPSGNGNIDNPADALTYNDSDKNGRKVGLSTNWTTGLTPFSNGKFKVKLQHQPNGIKKTNSGANEGDTDLELEFVLNIN